MAFACYLDDDSHRRAFIVPARERGHRMVTSAEAGLEGVADEQHLSYATGQGLVLISSNIKDFARLHRDWLDAGRSHAGIIVVHQQRFDPGELLRRFELMQQGLTTEDMRDRIEYLSNWGRSV